MDLRLARRIRFSARTGCWLWTGPQTDEGYGILKTQWRRDQQAHRAVWEEVVGRIPPNLVFRHGPNCPKLCVSPFHSRGLGTVRDNTLDALADGALRFWRSDRNACGSGHPYVEGSFSMRACRGRKPYRVCLICERAGYRRRRSS